MSGVWGFSRVFGSAFQFIKAHPWVLAAIALAKAAQYTLTAWRGQERAINSLNQSLINQGIYSRELSEQYQELALAIQQQTIFADEEVISSQAVMQSYLGGMTISRELMMTVADFAAGSGKSLEAAAEAVAKSVGTATNVLSKQGIVLTESMTKGEKLAAVMRGLNGKWQGQAAAQTQGLGAITQAGNALASLVESVGQRLAPMISDAAKGVTGFLKSLSENTKLLNKISDAMEVMQVGAIALVAIKDVLLKGLVTQLTNSAHLFRGVTEGKLKEYLAEISKSQNELLEFSRARAKQFVSDGKGALSARAQREADQHDKEESMLRRSIESRGQRIRPHQEKVDELTKIRSENEARAAIVHQNLKGDERLRDLNERIAHEKDETKKLELELKKRKIIQDENKKIEESYHRKQHKIGLISDKAKRDLYLAGIDRLAALQGSKYSELIAIGKAAAIARIIVDTVDSILFTMDSMVDAFGGEFGPIIGGVLSGLLALYSIELISNIADIDLSNSGKPTSGMTIDLDTIIKAALSVGLNLALNQLNYIFSMFTRGLDHVDPWDAASNYPGGPGFKDRLDNGGGGGDGGIKRGPGGGSPTNPEGFGAFAEGGIVRYIGGKPTREALPQGSGLGNVFNVTIRGGLVPSAREARRIASHIHEGR